MIGSIIVGIIAGYTAGKLTKGKGFGLIINLIVGVCGAVIGGWVFGLLGISIGNGFFGSLITAVIGAVLFLFLVKLVRS